jgi:hypothetical protein
MATPTKPSTSPSHCRFSTASFNSQPAPTAVNSGWMPTTRLATPAGRPFEIDMKTPPR